MPLVLTQSDFRANLTKYLDQVNDDEVIYIVRSNSRLVAFLSQDKLYWMKQALQSKEDSSTFNGRSFFVFLLIFTLIPNLFSSWDFA